MKAKAKKVVVEKEKEVSVKVVKCLYCKDTGRDQDGVTPCSECGKSV